MVVAVAAFGEGVATLSTERGALLGVGQAEVFIQGAQDGGMLRHVPGVDQPRKDVHQAEQGDDDGRQAARVRAAKQWAYHPRSGAGRNQVERGLTGRAS